MDYFEAYGSVAGKIASPSLLAGRRLWQADAEINIGVDILAKLDLKNNMRLLDIGCGVGVLTDILAGQVDQVVGVDHEAMLARYKQAGVPANVSLTAGAWPGALVEGLFDRVVAYSVLHYLSDLRAARGFIDACLRFLAPGGALLVGDIPNDDALRRWLASDEGKKSDGDYRRKVKVRDRETIERDRIFDQVTVSNVHFDDVFMSLLLLELRQTGYEAYLVSQPLELPFSHSREDLLVWKHK